MKANSSAPNDLPTPAAPADEAAPASTPLERDPQSDAQAAASSRVRPRKLTTLLAAAWKFLVGVLFCQSFLGSVAIIGWTYRLAQRVVLKAWWKQSAFARSGGQFEEFAAQAAATANHVTWPNWIVRQRAWQSIREARSAGARGQIRTIPAVAVHSLARNVKLGMQAIFNTWVLTMPACVLWVFSWWAGWDNSFNKGHEQFWVGPLTGWLGVVLFIAAMYYVPMAQMRQASTGDWRAFYQFHFVWDLIRRRWLACVLLAGLYSLLSLPVMVIRIAPEFVPQMNRAIEGFSDAQSLDFLKRYYFWTAFVFLPAFVVLRIVAARVYASAILSGVRKGSITEEHLGESEWSALHRLQLLAVEPERNRHVLVRLAAWMTTGVGRVVAGFAIFLIWFAFVAQIFVPEFMNLHPVRGWLNQPLVQLPWLDFWIPARLSNPWTEIGVGVLLLCVIWVMLRATRTATRWRATRTPAQPTPAMDI